MPKDQRKRGRAKKRHEAALARAEPLPETVEAAEPPAKRARLSEDAEADVVHASSDWPKLETDTRAFFKSIEARIIELEALGIGAAAADGEDDEEDERTRLMRGSLQQLTGHEIELATDAEASIILERLAHSMDDFARRVLADRFAGQYAALARHPFASHVLQTLFMLAARTIERERRGTVAEAPDELASGSGTLPLMTDLMSAACTELAADAAALVSDQCGAHVLRAALRLSYGLPLLSSSGTSGGDSYRSRRSKRFMAHQAPLRSMLDDEPTSNFTGQSGAVERREVPKVLRSAGKTLLSSLDRLWQQPAALKSAGAHNVAALTVQLVLEIEASKGKTKILTRLIGAATERNDYVETLMRDQTGSRLLEVVLAVASDETFAALWSTYFDDDRLPKLAAHPVSNFVVARAIARLDADGLFQVASSLMTADTARKLIVESRTGIFRALLERANELHADPSPTIDALRRGTGIADEPDLAEREVLFLLCVLSLKPLDILRKNPHAAELTALPAVTLQGAVLLQSWLQLPAPHSTLVTEAMRKLPRDLLIRLGCDKTSSHVIDAALRSPAVEIKERRRLVQVLTGVLSVLAQDRIGSRVCDSCWTAADTFLKGKMAAALVPHMVELHGSDYGRFFARKLMLPVYETSPDVWAKKIAAQSTTSSGATAAAAAAPRKLGKATQQTGQRRDEIDDVFAIAHAA